MGTVEESINKLEYNNQESNIDRYRVENIKEKLRDIRIILRKSDIYIIEMLEDNNSADGNKVGF